MKLFIAFVVFKLLVDDVILALLMYTQRKQSKINQDFIEMSEKKWKDIDRIDRTIRLERIERERKRTHDPCKDCNYSGHEWKWVNETVVKTIGGNSIHYHDYVCSKCGKKKTITEHSVKHTISRWEGEK